VAAVAFPNIKPTARAYSPGSYPKNEFQALNGAVSILRYGNRRSQSELSLSFDNITDDNAALILANYEKQMSGDNWITFTAANGLKGAGASLAAYMAETASGLRWRYAEPPSVESVFPGRSSVRIKFVANLDG
jgi:hypothetical protein